MRSLRRRTIAMLRTNGGDHPCVFVTDPVKRQGKGRAEVLYVPLSTSRGDDRDIRCEFKESPDRRIMAGSFVYYRMARIRDAAEVEAELRRRGRSLSELAVNAYRRIVAELKKPGVLPRRELEFYEEAVRRGKAD